MPAVSETDVIKFLTGKEDDSDRSIGSADTDVDLETDDISRAVTYIAIGHQEMSSGYHDLAVFLPTKCCRMLKIM